MVGVVYAMWSSVGGIKPSEMYTRKQVGKVEVDKRPARHQIKGD